MTVVSKELFNKLVDNESCKHIVHPNWTCISSCLYIFAHSLPGVFKFYVSIYILELLLNHKKTNKEYLKNQMLNFMKSWAYGVTMTNVMFSSVCMCRHILGHFYYQTSVFLPGFLSGISMLLENPRMQILNTIFFTELTLECGVNYLKGEDIIRNSINLDTLFFMINNAIFLYLFKTNALAKRATLLWFFDSRPKKDKKNETVLSCCEGDKHKCLKHIFKEATSYFKTGYAFHVLKGLVSKFHILVKNPLYISSMIFNKKAIYNGFFFASYVFIYKVICKYLYEIEGKEKDIHSLIAGFSAGISYSISPSIQMNLLPPTLILQLLWINLREKYKIPKWYFMELYFAVCLGIIFHFRFIKPNYTPKYVMRMVTMVTDGKGDVFLNNIMNYLEYKIKQKGVPITKYMHMAG